jgi:anti-sigma regulatory factor (Ser/Thr protein kinase)
VADEAAARDGLAHLALFYRDQTEYLAGVRAFAHDGLVGDEPVFVAVPGDKVGLVRAQLGERFPRVSYGDMAEMGRNPGRVIPALRDFAEAHRGRRVRLISEPVWPGRPAAETREATKHDALINLAFSGTPVTIMCPYDAAGLPTAAISEARCTHPAIVQDGQPLASADFAGPGFLPPQCHRPLPVPPSSAAVLHYAADLRPLRRMVADHADRAGLAPERATDLVLAVSEIGANTLRHTSGAGRLQVWHTEQEILCQVQDRGWITDPLAGQQRRPASERGHGLWVVNQVCDLVEVRTGQAGTTVRLHMRLGEVRTRPARAPQPRPQVAGTACTLRRSPG